MVIIGAERKTRETATAGAELREALESLPAMEREILLRRFEGYTRKEIARAIQMCPTSVQNYEIRAISFLRNREKVKVGRAA